MKPEDILLRISDSFASGANNGRQFIIVNELLGKAQTDLIKVLNQGSTAIIEQGESMGVLSDDQIASLSEVSDAMKTLQITVQNAFGQMAVFIVPVRDAFVQFAEELTMVGYAAKTLLSGDLKGAMAVIAAARESHAESLKPKARQASKTPVMTDNVELASITEEKKKQDKKLFDEELYDLQEASRLEASRDKTLFDRMMRDAEFSRDEKKRILALEKETAQKNREIIMRGMEASGTILDKARASAERLGNFGLVRQIDQERQQQQRQTDVSLLEGIGASPGGFGFRKNEQVQALTQTEGELQRTQNTELLGSFKDMQRLVTNILQKVDDKLGVPILRSAN
jgi:hypothetical protein